RRVGVTGLQRRDHAAGFVAQRTHFVERGVVACAHEAAVALEVGKLLGQRRVELARERGVELAQRARRLRQLGGDVRALLQLVRKACGGRRSRAAGAPGGPPGAPARRAGGRGRSGAAANRSRMSARAVASVTKNSTASWRRAIAAGSVSGAARRWASRRAPAAVTVRAMAARSDPRRSPESVRTSPRLLRVARSIGGVAAFGSRPGTGQRGGAPALARPP